MEVEKKRSKGGFLNLFDWNGKSRKKLFSENYELPELPTILAEERLNQATKNVENLSNSQMDEIKVTENVANSALSMAVNEGCGTRAPSVVARLMGLDSLPSSIVNEACSTSSTSSREYLCKGNVNEFGNDSRITTMNFIKMGMPKKGENFSSNMGQNRPIERFQTEILPPKSAKSIPITHHKLLSPIKGPGFVPTRNAAYVMEAAAKIIVTSPRGTVKTKESIIGHSSMPLRIRDLKVRAEAAQRISSTERPEEASVGKLTKRQLPSKSQNELKNGHALSVSSGSGKVSSDSLRNTGKSVSPIYQEKVNVQCRAALPCSNKNSIILKEQNEAKAKQKTEQKRTSLNKTNVVLAQNNRKQNSIPNKVKPNSKAETSSCSKGPCHSLIMVGSETESIDKTSAVTDSGRKLSSSKRKNVAQKRRLVSQSVSSTGSVVNNPCTQKGERSIKYNVTKDSSTNLDSDSRKQTMDIVSFTFTSPLKKSSTESRFSNLVMELSCSLLGVDGVDEDDGSCLKNATSSPGLDVMHGDALSVLLEQKLQELTCKVESYSCDSVQESSLLSSGTNLPNSLASTGTSTARVDDERFRPWLTKDKSDGSFIDYSSTPNGLVLDHNLHRQGLEETEEHNSYNNEKRVSTAELSFLKGSCSDDKDTANYTTKCSSIEARDMTNSYCMDHFLQILEDSPFSESPSSNSAGDIFGMNKNGSSKSIDCKRSNIWDLEYVRKIFSSMELALEDIALHIDPAFFSHNLFDHLEIRDNELERESSKLKRKLLFDCGNEFLESKCRETVVGSYGSWKRLKALFEGKESLGEELYREIAGWRAMEEMMVDEVLEKDMSTQCGKWVNFEIEAAEESVEIENEILTTLVQELTAELVICGRPQMFLTWLDCS